MQRTPNYNLLQYEDTDVYLKDDLNDSFSKVDAALSEIQETINVSDPLTIVQEVINARKEFKDSGRLVDKINGIDSTLSGHTSSLTDNQIKLNFIDRLKLKFVYGAIGDGVADDTTAIQNYINDMFTNGGGVVYIPKGTYIVTNIKLRQYVSMQGIGGDTCIIKKKTGTTGNVIEFMQENTSYLYNTFYKDFTVQGTGIDYNGKTVTDSTNNGFVVNPYWGLDGCTFENILIRNCGGTGLMVIPSPVNTAGSEAMVLQQSIFTNVTTQYCGAGTLIKGFVGNIQWNTCTFDFCINNAFESQIGANGNGSQDNSFYNCAFQHADKGFYLGSGCINMNFYGCHFENIGTYSVHINTAQTGVLNFNGCGFYTSPIHVYFQTFVQRATFNGNSFKALTNGSSTERFIKVEPTVSGLVFIGAGNFCVPSNDLPTRIEDTGTRTRGYKNFDTVLISDIESVQSATLQNGWVNLANVPAQFYKDSNGIVHLQGVIQNGTATQGTILFTLPSGYRPLGATRYFIVNSNYGVGSIGISLTGSVTITSGSNAFLSFEGVSFRTT